MQQTWFISISILFVGMGQGPWEPESWLISSRNDPTIWANIVGCPMGKGLEQPKIEARHMETITTTTRHDANPLWMSELNLANTGRQCAKMD